jgi:hypothetical protein
LKGGRDDKMSRPYKLTVEVIGVSKEQLNKVMSDQFGWEGEVGRRQGVSIFDGDGNLSGGMREEEAHEKIHVALKKLNPKVRMGTQWTCMENLPCEFYGENLEDVTESDRCACITCGRKNDPQDPRHVDCHTSKKTTCPKCCAEITHMIFHAKANLTGVSQSGYANSSDWDSKSHRDTSRHAFSCPECNEILFNTKEDAENFLVPNRDEQYMH